MQTTTQIKPVPPTKSCRTVYYFGAFYSWISTRATKGIGRTAPNEWKDAGEALNHVELKGCHMPAGDPHDLNPDGAYLQYNEVRNTFCC